MSRRPRTWPKGYTRAKAGNIGLCIGTSGPAGTDMITGLYSASADSIPILCITGQAPRARLTKEDFQAVDIAAIAAPVTKWAVTVMEPYQVPMALQKAFHLMRSGRPGPVLIDLPIDVQLAEIEFDIDAYEPLPPFKPQMTRKQAEKALAMLNEAERPLIVAGGGIINADASDLLIEFAEIAGVPVVPTLMGWGTIPDDHPLMAGMCGLQTSHRYGNATMLASDFVLGIGNRWANRHTGSVDKYTAGRKFIHIDIEPTQIGRVFAPDLGVVSDAGAALKMLLDVATEWKAAGRLRDWSGWAKECRQRRKKTMKRKTHFDQMPLKPQRVYEEMNKALPRDTTYVTTIGLSQIAGAQFLHVYKPRNWINCGQAGPLGWTLPAALGVRAADPDRTIVALSGDYDFQFLIEELAVGAQHKLPFIHVVVNNAYLGLIRQAQRGFQMDFEVSLAFDNINAAPGRRKPATASTMSRSPRRWAARRSACASPRSAPPRSSEAERLTKEFQVPVVIEFILERVTNISMGTEIDNGRRVRGTCRKQRRRADRDRAAGLRRTRHAALFSQSVDALWRARVPRPFRCGRPRRLQGRRIYRALRP